MKIISCLILALLFAASIFAQDSASVIGTLTDGGRVIANQTIRLVSGTVTIEMRTDADGKYRFDNVTDGRYLLMHGNKGANVIVKDGRVTIAELADVVVIAANQEQPLEQVSRSVDVIAGQEMRDRADFTLIESLRSIPGFRVQQLGGFGRVASIKSRGLRNQDTAVLLDGVRFRDVTAISGDATPFLSDITLTSVSKVEVLRGSGSSLYGTNAIGGVVDLQTPQARSGTHGQIGGAVGGLGLGRFRGNLSHGTANGRFGIGAGFAQTVYKKGIDGNDEANNTNFQTRFDAIPSDRTKLSGKIFFSRADVELNVNPDTLGMLPPSNATVIVASPGVNFVADANDPDRDQRSRFFSGQVSAEQAFNNKVSVGGHYHGISSSRTNNNGPLGPGFQSASTSVFDGRIDTVNGRVSWFASPENQLTVGYEFEREYYRNKGLTPTGSDDNSTSVGQNSQTLYVQDLVSLLDGRLQINGALRYQRFSLGRPQFSLLNAPYSDLNLSDPPSAFVIDGAVSYFVPKSGSKIRFHVGNGYRVPSLYERFGSFYSSFGMPAFIAIGDPFLKPEKSLAFDAGLEQRATADRITLTATYFYTMLTDIIGYGNFVPDIGSTPRPFGGYENQRGGRSRGGEFSFRAMPYSSTEIFASYTFTNSRQRTPQVTGTGINRTLGIPDHQFTLVATQRIKRAWINFDLLATSNYLAPIFSGSTFTTYLYRFGGNRRGDLTAGYTFALRGGRSTMRVFGTIENLFDHEYFENGFRTVGRTARIGATFGF